MDFVTQSQAEAENPFQSNIRFGEFNTGKASFGNGTAQNRPAVEPPPLFAPVLADTNSVANSTLAPTIVRPTLEPPFTDALTTAQSKFPVYAPTPQQPAVPALERHSSATAAASILSPVVDDSSSIATIRTSTTHQPHSSLPAESIVYGHPHDSSHCLDTDMHASTLSDRSFSPFNDPSNHNDAASEHKDAAMLDSSSSISTSSSSTSSGRSEATSRGPGEANSSHMDIDSIPDSAALQLEVQKPAVTPPSQSSLSLAASLPRPTATHPSTSSTPTPDHDDFTPVRNRKPIKPHKGKPSVPSRLNQQIRPPALSFKKRAPPRGAGAKGNAV
jgi:hypothetical protein